MAIYLARNGSDRENDSCLKSKKNPLREDQMVFFNYICDL